MLGGPQIQFCFEADWSITDRICGYRLLNSSLSYFDVNLLISCGAVNFDPAGDLIARTFLKLEEIVLDKSLRHFDECYFTSQASIVPPVSVERRHSITTTFVVDLDDKIIVFLMNKPCNLKVEWSETTFMTT